MSPVAGGPDLLAVRDLTVRFSTEDGQVLAVDTACFEVAPGEVLALVGESGCGKSVTALALTGLLPRSASVTGEIRFARRPDILDPTPPGGVGGWAGSARAGRARTVGHPWPGHRVRLPGADDLAESGRWTASASPWAPARWSAWSASGKSTLGRCVTRLVPVTSGQVRLNGRDIAGLSRRAVRPLRRDFTIVFQDPASSLDPRMTVADIVAEPLRLHRIGAAATRRERVLHQLDQLGFPRGSPALPARAIRWAAPTGEPGPGAGGGAVPAGGRQRSRRRIVLTGEVPSPVDPPPGCRFHTRCPVAVPRCAVEVPLLRLVAGGHVACHLVPDDGTPASASQ